MITVLDSQLAKNGTGWLVGDRLTYADLSSLMYANITGNGGMVAKNVDTGKWKEYTQWVGRMREKESVKVIMKMLEEEWIAMRAAQGQAQK